MELNLSSVVKRLEVIGLILPSKPCKRCGLILNHYFHQQASRVFYCTRCNILTPWNNDCVLKDMHIDLSTLEILMNKFVENSTAQETFQLMNSCYVSKEISLKTVSRYFKIFSQIALQYYKKMHNTIWMKGEIEIDETQLYKEKKIICSC